MSGTVFLSYATQDEIFVRTLARRLRDVGLEAWHYTAAERFGDDYTERLLAAIEQAVAVVVVLSTGSAASLPVLQEILHARTHRKRIIPVELEPCDGPVPFHLRPYYRINCWDRRNVAAEILHAVQDQARPPEQALTDYATLTVLHPFSDQASRTSVVLEAPADFVPLELPTERALCIVGRDPRHPLSFPQPHVSRTHARFSLRISSEGVTYVLYDLESKFGVYLNGARISGSQSLRNSDQIGLGTPAAMLLFAQLDPTGHGGATNLLPDDER